MGLALRDLLYNQTFHQWRCHESSLNHSLPQANRPDSGPVNLQRDRTTKQGNRNNDPTIPLKINQNPFEAAQGFILDPDSLANFQVRPGFSAHSRRNDCPDSGDL
jgi:hypothetical protein